MKLTLGLLIIHYTTIRHNYINLEGPNYWCYNFF